MNDGLMAVFFLLVGLELKREVAEGELSSPEQIALPALAAIGGLVVPALIYWLINRDNPQGINGWAIPTATDIAFALAILSLLGNRVPASLKVFLTTIAIFDDLAAIVIIALFYSGDLSTLSLIAAAAGILVLFALNRLGVKSLAAYLIVGIFIWLFVLKSGVHATLAGIAVAAFIPLKDGDDHSPSRHLEHILHPWVAYGVLPIFAFANAGIPFAGVSSEAVLGTVSTGIMLGLFFGKQVGVFGMTALVIGLGLAQKTGRIQLGHVIRHRFAVRNWLYNEPVYRRTGVRARWILSRCCAQDRCHRRLACVGILRLAGITPESAKNPLSIPLKVFSEPDRRAS